MFSLRFLIVVLGWVVVVVDMVEPAEVVDVDVVMRTGGSGEIDCENGEGLLATVCNECCEKSSGCMLDWIKNSHALKADLDMYMILGVPKDCLTSSKTPKDSRRSRGPPEEYLGRFGCEVCS